MSPTELRKPGWYWVKPHSEPREWNIARWNDAQAWWVIETDTEGNSTCGDGRWLVIGPYIPTPDEARSAVLTQMAKDSVTDGTYDVNVEVKP